MKLKAILSSLPKERFCLNICELDGNNREFVRYPSDVKDIDESSDP